MKDYRLSEIKEICEKMHNEFGKNACIYCENNGLGDFCNVEFENYPTDWYVDIEPRDMIELPCKEHFTYTHDNGHITENWRVHYRSEFNLIETAIFQTEAEADEYLEKIKRSSKQ